MRSHDSKVVRDRKFRNDGVGGAEVRAVRAELSRTITLYIYTARDICKDGTKSNIPRHKTLRSVGLSTERQPATSNLKTFRACRHNSYWYFLMRMQRGIKTRVLYTKFIHYIYLYIQTTSNHADTNATS